MADEDRPATAEEALQGSDLRPRRMQRSRSLRNGTSKPRLWTLVKVLSVSFELLFSTLFGKPRRLNWRSFVPSVRRCARRKSAGSFDNCANDE